MIKKKRRLSILGNQQEALLFEEQLMLLNMLMVVGKNIKNKVGEFKTFVLLGLLSLVSIACSKEIKQVSNRMREYNKRSFGRPKRVCRRGKSSIYSKGGSKMVNKIEMNIKKSGSLSFWGDWFGRPMDNYHIVESAWFNEDSKQLVINFDNNVNCIVYNPQGIISTEREFSITNASCILLSFERVNGTIYNIEYEKLINDSIIKREFVKENIGIITSRFDKANFKAFEIH